MDGSIDTLAGAVLWSKLGAAELLVGLIVGLMLLAFALPARLHGTEEGASEDGREVRSAGHRNP